MFPSRKQKMLTTVAAVRRRNNNISRTRRRKVTTMIATKTRGRICVNAITSSIAAMMIIITLALFGFTAEAGTASPPPPPPSTKIIGSSIRRNNIERGYDGLRWLKEESLQSHNVRHLKQDEHDQKQSRNMLQGSNFRRRQLKTARDACEAARADEEFTGNIELANPESDFLINGISTSICTCEEMKLDDRYAQFIDLKNQPVAVKLSCTDTRCSYCSVDGTTCDRFSYGAIYEEIPRTSYKAATIAQVAYFETSQYIVGRPETVVYTEYHDPTQTSKGNGIHSCSMDIDGLRCAVCEYIDCIGGDSNAAASVNNNSPNNLYYGLRVVCSNIKIGDGQGGHAPAQDFETCDPTIVDSIGASQGVFEMYDEEYGQCFTAKEACERDKSILDYNGSFYTCQCKSSFDDTDTSYAQDKNSPFLLDYKLRCLKKSNVGIYGEDCSGDGSTSDSLMRTYSSYATETESRTIINKHLGYDQTVSIYKSDCQTTGGTYNHNSINADYCDSCIATIDGNQCQQCTMVECTATGEGYKQPKINCDNIDAPNLQKGVEIDLCYDTDILDYVERTPFQYFSQRSGCGGFPGPPPPPKEEENNSSSNNKKDEKPVNIESDQEEKKQNNNNNNNNPPPKPSEVIPVNPEPTPPAPVPPPTPPPVKEIISSSKSCEIKANELGSRQNYVDGALMTCDCVDIGDGSTLLSCTTNDGGCGTLNGGSVCNTVYGNSKQDGSCFREELVQGFLPDGNKTPLTRTTTYTHGTGLGYSLIGRTLSLTDYENDNGSCQLLVDGTACNSCQIQKCNDNQIRPIIDCTNILNHQSFSINSCSEFSNYKDGFLLRLAASAIDNNEYTTFNVCSEPFTPQSTPVDASNPTQPDSVVVDNNPSSPVQSGVDPSLPITCLKAQPVVLAAQVDAYAAAAASSSALSRSSENAAFATVVSSTTGVPPSSSSPSSCTGEASGTNSPSLWYKLTTDGNGQGIHASVCHDPTNFDARISVYKSASSGGVSSSCDGLICVTGTPSNEICEVNWIVEKGVTYYIRVHGSTNEQTGKVNLFVQTIPDENMNSCKIDDALLNHACLKCAKERSAVLYEQGPMDCQCLSKGNGVNDGYYLTCVDTNCLKCNPIQDTCGFNTKELDIDASGSSSSSSTSSSDSSYTESFYFMKNEKKLNDMQSTEIVQLRNDNNCVILNDPYQTCMVNRDEIMSSSSDSSSGGNEKVFCECRGVSDDGDFMLLCMPYTSYQYCVGNDNNNNCATMMFGQTISQFGTVTTGFRNYELISDDNNDKNSKIMVERTQHGCSVSMNDQTCNKCEVCNAAGSFSMDQTYNFIGDIVGSSSSSGPFTDLSVDCSNAMNNNDISGAATTSFGCGNGQNANGPLSIFSGQLVPVNSSPSMGGEEEEEEQQQQQETNDNNNNDKEDPTDADSSSSSNNNIFDSVEESEGSSKQQQQTIQTIQTIPPDAFPPTTPPVTQPTSPPKTTTKAPSASPLTDVKGNEESNIAADSNTISNPDTVSFADGQLASSSSPPPLNSNNASNNSSNTSATAQNAESSTNSIASLTWRRKVIVLFSCLPLIHFLLLG